MPARYRTFITANTPLSAAVSAVAKYGGRVYAFNDEEKEKGLVLHFKNPCTLLAACKRVGETDLLPVAYFDFHYKVHVVAASEPEKRSVPPPCVVAPYKPPKASRQEIEEFLKKWMNF